MKSNHAFFQNRACEYFPCHETSDIDSFNCMFCYCPLYTLGNQCGGNCRYSDNGIKDCSHCLLPHSPAGYDYINAKFSMIAELAVKNNK